MTVSRTDYTQETFIDDFLAHAPPRTPEHAARAARHRAMALENESLHPRPTPFDHHPGADVRQALLAFVLAAACGNTIEPLPPGGHHVLFIGNSLTYTNDLPGTVADLATVVGDTIRVRSVAKPDFALIDHLNGGSDALAQIKSGGWDYVVLQQGPSSLPVNQDSLRLWTQLFDPYIRAVGAKPALLMVWPSADLRGSFDAVRTSYQNAAIAVNGVFLPAGAAWQIAWAENPSLQLYGPDLFHPSELGTYAAALVTFECITHRDAQSLPATARVAGHTLNVDSATVRLLQRAAHQAIVQYHGC